MGLEKKLRRAAAEPSRVFAMSDWRDQRWPVSHIVADGDDWYGPCGGPWVFRGNDPENRVLQRALDSWGTTTLSASVGAVLETWIEAPGIQVSFTDPAYEILTDGKEVAAMRLVERPECFTTAVPVFYAIRRYGSDGQFETLTEPVLRYRCDGQVVAVIGLVTPPVKEAAA